MEKFKNLEEAQAAFEAQAGELKTAQKEIATLNANIEELNAIITDVRNQKQTSAGNLSFQAGKKTVSIDAKKFNWKGTNYTDKDVVKNKKLQEELLDAKVGFLTIVED